MILNKDKTYSVSQLGKLAGVSVRTLHHYDAIGLLTPSRRSDNGYREYYPHHLALLKQIIIYRELDLSLEAILKIMKSDDFDLISALKDQRDLLLKQQQQTQSIINTIEVTMNALEGKNNLELLFDGLPKGKTERWGDMLLATNSNNQNNETLAALGALSKLTVEVERDRFNEWVNGYRKLLSHPINSDAVQQKIKDHYIMTNRFLKNLSQCSDFKGIGYEGYLLITDKVLSEPVTNEMYEHYQAGMSEHLHEAMMFFAEHYLKFNVEQLRKSSLFEQ